MSASPIAHTKGPVWSADELAWLRGAYSGRDGLLMLELIDAFNEAFPDRPTRTYKAVKDKISNLGLKRHPERKAEIMALNRLLGGGRPAARDEDMPHLAPSLPWPPHRFEDADAQVLKRERETPGYHTPVRRPLVERSHTGCTAALAAA